jgi:hypothetical protein
VNFLIEKNLGIDGLVAAESGIEKGFDLRLVELVKVRRLSNEGLRALSP